MAGWNEIMKEIANTDSQQDYIRHKYLQNLNQITGRNIIAYYSSWLKYPNTSNIDINDSDMNGFMNCIHEMDCSMGLDLILHTPGGSPTAAEAIVHYLREKFNKDIRVIVPQLAMSAGTMIACSAKTILMGRQSSLGPIDPQFSGIPAHSIMSEFLEAKEDLKKNPNNANYWAIKLQQYPAGFMKIALDAISLSDELVREWLGSCMFNKNNSNDEKIINKIVGSLNEHDNSKIHDRHLNAGICKEIGLKIEMIEDDNKLQDAILSLHHAYMITLDTTKTVKIIESQNKKRTVSLG